MTAVRWENRIRRQKPDIKGKIYNISPPLRPNMYYQKGLDKKAKVSLSQERGGAIAIIFSIGNVILNNLQWGLGDPIESSFDDKNNKIIYLKKSKNKTNVSHLHKSNKKNILSFSLRLRFNSWFTEEYLKERGSKTKSYYFEIKKNSLMIDMTREVE